VYIASVILVVAWKFHTDLRQLLPKYAAAILMMTLVTAVLQ
jgi:hypothetical protein